MNATKRTKSILTLIAAVSALLATNVMAQEMKKPTLEDLIPGGETYRRIENKWYAWYGDQLCLELGIDSIRGITTGLGGIGVKTGKEHTLCTLEQVNRLLSEKGLDTLRHFYSTRVIDRTYRLQNSVVEINYPKQLLLFNTPKHRVLVKKPDNPLSTAPIDVLGSWNKLEVIWSQSRPQGAANENWNEVSRHLAYTRGNNLYVLTADEQTLRVTDEPEGIVCGQSVHRNEFGISKGTFWSPKGDLLAFYRMDESMVTEYPLVDITARTGEVNPVRYPMAGMTSHKVTVGIYTPSTQQTLYLNTGDPKDRYFTNISWAPDGKSLFLIEVNRDQNYAKLCQYSAETGELMHTLLEEHHPKYVEPQHPILFLPWDDNKFIYQSQRDGYNHLYLYDLKKLTEQKAAAIQLTQGDWMVQEVVGFNRKTKQIIILSTEDSPLQSNVYAVSVKNGKRTRIGDKEGVHSVQLSNHMGMYLIDKASYPDRPRVIKMLSTDGKKEHTLFTAKNPYEGLEMPSIETGTLKAADGKTDLYYRLIKPTDFDPAKKYPAIVYVYGGPHAQMITNGWMNDARGWDIYMANKGYIMFSLDNRGSSNRGLEFENCTFRRLGIEEGKDQVKGVEFLKSQPYVDGERIGVHGWSFGGHMTTALMLRYPEIFKVGVAGGPVIDWAYYEIMYGERYMDTPQTNPEGYKQTNLKNLAGNLKGHLLIIHDDHDDTCVPQHTLSFMKACVDARTYPDLFIYPTHKHNVLGRDRVHLHEKITRYFEDHL